MDLIRRRRIVLAMDCIAWPQEPRPWKALALFFSYILGSKWHLLLCYAFCKRRMGTFDPNLAIYFLRGTQNSTYLRCWVSDWRNCALLQSPVQDPSRCRNHQRCRVYVWILTIYLTESRLVYGCRQ